MEEAWELAVVSDETDKTKSSIGFSQLDIQMKTAIVAGVCAIIAALIYGLASRPPVIENKVDYSKYEKANFNTANNDHNLITLSNVSRDGISTDLWKDTETAKLGDQVNVLVFYNNHGPERSFKTKVSLTSSDCKGVKNCEEICGKLWSSNSASDVIGCARLFLPDNSTLVFANDVVWRPSASSWGKKLFIDNQTGTEIFTSTGLNFGEIGYGEGTHGSIIVNSIVSKPVREDTQTK